jgi:hypothetical protein
MVLPDADLTPGALILWWAPAYEEDTPVSVARVEPGEVGTIVGVEPPGWSARGMRALLLRRRADQVIVTFAEVGSFCCDPVCLRAAPPGTKEGQRLRELVSCVDAGELSVRLHDADVTPSEIETEADTVIIPGLLHELWGPGVEGQFPFRLTVRTTDAPTLDDRAQIDQLSLTEVVRDPGALRIESAFPATLTVPTTDKLFELRVSTVPKLVRERWRRGWRPQAEAL